jgi:segregation and condensation protein A
MTSTRAPSRLPSQHGFEPFLVELERFHGPLDLLLHLIRAQDIDIFDIPIAKITSQFQAVLEAGFEQVELEVAGEFLELAATLVRIKAQLLLPRPGEVDWTEDPRADLVRRLLEYELFQEVAHVLSGAEADRARHFAKGYLEPRPRSRVRPKLTTTLDEFLEAAGEVPEPMEESRHMAPLPGVTVEEKISLIERRLRREDRMLFSRLFRSWKQRSHVVASLLACLEMARQQVLRIEQVKRFGSIWIFSRKETTQEPEESV